MALFCISTAPFLFHENYYLLLIGSQQPIFNTKPKMAGTCSIKYFHADPNINNIVLISMGLFWIEYLIRKWFAHQTMKSIFYRINFTSRYNIIYSLFVRRINCTSISFISQIHKIVSCNGSCKNYNEFMMAGLHRRAYKLSLLCGVTTFMTGIYCSRKKYINKPVLRLKLC